MWPQGVCCLPGLSGVRQALRRPVPRSSLAAAHAAARHPRERSKEPVQQASRIGVGGETKPERRLIPLASVTMDTGISSAVGWINLTTRLLRFASFGRAALHASVARRATSIGFDPHLVSSWLSRHGEQARPPMRGIQGRLNRHALQSGDRFRPCQLRKNRRCPMGSSVVPKAESAPPAAPPSPLRRLSRGSTISGAGGG